MPPAPSSTTSPSPSPPAGGPAVVPPGCPLTRRQFETILAVVDGDSYELIAARQGRTASAVRSQVMNAGIALGERGAIDIATRCLREGWCLVAPTRRAWSAPTPVEAWLTNARQLYLAAFELHLRSATDAERDATRAIMVRLRPELLGAAI